MATSILDRDLPPPPQKGAIKYVQYQFKAIHKTFVFLNVLNVCYQKIIKKKFFSKNRKRVKLQIVTIYATDMLGNFSLDSSTDHSFDTHHTWLFC